jgi:fructuronate reductase
MKLRMLNGTHSMLAYAGFLSGRRHVRDAMADPAMTRLVERHLRAAAGTLAPLAGVDLDEYARALVQRFANPAIAHETYQIAMDGTEKLPQRLLAPAAEVAAREGDLRPFAFAVAAWMRYALGRTDEGEAYALRDPREAEIARALAGERSPAGIAAGLHRLPALFPAVLADNPVWTRQVVGILATMLDRGMAGAVALEAARGQDRCRSVSP